jgi:hypothetical protein
MSIIKTYKPDAELSGFKKKIFKASIINMLQQMLPVFIFEKLIQLKSVFAKE